MTTKSRKLSSRTSRATRGLNRHSHQDDHLKCQVKAHREEPEHLDAQAMTPEQAMVGADRESRYDNECEPDLRRWQCVKDGDVE